MTVKQPRKTNQIRRGGSEISRNRVIVVLAMHRTGSSAITRGLLALGVDLGDNLLGASEDDNAKGFWEDLDILSFNDVTSDCFVLTSFACITLDPIDLACDSSNSMLKEGL